MSAIVITDANLRVLKRSISQVIPAAISSHVTESIAAGFGFSSNAAIRSRMKQMNDDPDILCFQPRSFATRLNELSENRVRVKPNLLNQVTTALPSDQIIPTAPYERKGYKWISMRSRAWRSAMVAGINEGIRRRHFTVRPGDNRWVKTSKEHQEKKNSDRSVDEGIGYRFSIGDIPAHAHVADIGFDELSLKVTLWPSNDDTRLSGAYAMSRNAALHSGDLKAQGYFERKDGAWLQVSRLGPDVFVRRHRLAQAADLVIEPLGYSDCGPFKM